MTLLAAVVWLLNGSFEDVAVITVVASSSYAFGSVIMPYVLSFVDDIRLVLLGASSVRAAAAAMIVVLGWRRSEERRVGKECREWRRAMQYKTEVMTERQ